LLTLIAVAKAAGEPGGGAYHSWLWEVLQGPAGQALTEVTSGAEASATHALCMTQVQTSRHASSSNCTLFTPELRGS
jgi:hypothetical protein